MTDNVERIRDLLIERGEVDAGGISNPTELATAIAAMQPTPQEAAKVLLDAGSHTEKAATYAAAKEFPQMGFINAGAVIGAALRAISEDSK